MRRAKDQKSWRTGRRTKQSQRAERATMPIQSNPIQSNPIQSLARHYAPKLFFSPLQHEHFICRLTGGYTCGFDNYRRCLAQTKEQQQQLRRHPSGQNRVCQPTPGECMKIAGALDWPLGSLEGGARGLVAPAWMLSRNEVILGSRPCYWPAGWIHVMGDHRCRPGTHTHTHTHTQRESSQSL
ncbi:hypothetical protein BO71DRAFT_43882 [Aspergillus ellipticus CBS 707.79]|uniref:Uncharacterized protein n=1 Tax=Aspergillus ellipticus CBS 707.79 TaxID=1448320 RepID=A0A319D3K6_9EURO|nr:hypothetical protein BO71DRAFT_43882 [Aspergillus ellipticus CBS 707.79]